MNPHVRVLFSRVDQGQAVGIPAHEIAEGEVDNGVAQSSGRQSLSLGCW